MPIVAELFLFDEYDKLLYKLAHECALNNAYTEAKVTALYPIKGNRYNHELMVIGRAVNGWGESDKLPWRPADAVDIDERRRILQKVYDFSHTSDGSCPMQWVADYWERREKGKYNTKKSAFWRVIHDVLIELRITTPTDRDWSSHLVWSDLYKAAPSTTGNPSSKLIKVQREICELILEKELATFTPKRVLFLTGYNWLKDDFSKLLSTFVIKKTDFSKDALAQVFAEIDLGNPITSSVVIAKHPQGKNSRKWVEEVVRMFSGQ